MIVNVLYGTYFIYKDGSLNIIKNKKEFDYYIKDTKYVIINNSDYVDELEKILDLRIFNWLINNLTSNSFLTSITAISHQDVIKLCETQKRYILENKYFIPLAIKYTKYYKSLNSLFKFDYNKNHYYILLEKYCLEAAIKNDVPEYQLENNLIHIENKLHYTFLNIVGKIYPTNKFLQSIDRKTNIDLFKIDKNRKYYLIDFIAFEPSIIFLYTKNKEYINIDFYNIHANKSNIERAEFKYKFLAWFNGAGNRILGDKFKIYFNNNFQDIIEVKNRMQDFKFTNCFNHTMFYKSEHSKFGALIQSTAYDLLLRMYDYFYGEFKENENIRFIYNLFDEFLIETDKGFDIEKLTRNFKFLNYTIKEC